MMEVREIVSEEIKKGMRIIHKRGYENRGWREDKVKTISKIVITTNGTHSHVVYDNGGFDYLFDLGDHYFEVVEDKPTGIPTFDGDLPIGTRQDGKVMTYIGGTARHAADGKNYNVMESDKHGKYKIIGDDGNEWHCAKESFIDVVEHRSATDPRTRHFNGLRINEAECQNQYQEGKDLPQGTKLDSGKLKPTLLLDDMPLAINEILKVLQFGAEKYSEGNWLKVPNGINRYRNAADRHRLAIDELDDESGLLHLAHEATSVLMLLELKLREYRNAE